MNNIMVSISMITYNHEKYIQKAIESVLMQKTNFDYELLIHDDASTDKTADIIKKFESEYPNIIKPIYQMENQYSKNVKISYTYNFTRAKGKYIALCEGDDYWIDPLKIQKQVDYLEDNSNCPMCFHAADKVNENGVVFGQIKPSLFDCNCSVEDIMCRKIICPTASIIFRKKLVETIPDFMMKCPVGDYPLELYLASKGDLRYLADKMSAYRYGHVDSWTQKTFHSVDSKQKAYKFALSIISTSLQIIYIKMPLIKNKKGWNLIHSYGLKTINSYEKI